MGKKRRVILIPGLGDRVAPLEWVAGGWTKYGLEPVVFAACWRAGESFETKLDRLTDLIDQFAGAGERVSLVGMSAGGSLAVNGFLARKDKVYRVVNVCGRLKVGPTFGSRGFAARTAASPAFAESVRNCEKGLAKLPAGNRARIMSIRPHFGDELVPVETASVEGAVNWVLPTGEHVVSIAAALTVFSGGVIKFLKKEKSHGKEN